MRSSKFSNTYKFLLLLPFITRIIEESIFPALKIGGKGITFWAFLVFWFGTIMYNSGNLLISLKNRIVYLYLIFIGAAFITEFLHTNSVYREASTTFFMFAAIPLYASWVLKNIQSFKYIVASFLFYALVHAVNITLNISIFKMLATGDSDEARATISQKLWFYTNLNGIATTTGTAAVVCFVIARNVTNKIYKRWLYFLTAIYMYASAVCVSRAAFLSIGVIMIWMYLKYRPKVKFQYFIPLAVMLLLLDVGPIQKVTNLFFGRFAEINFNTQGDKVDSRVRVYSNVIKYLPEVYLTGVGEGNFYGEWGQKSTFARIGYDEEGNISGMRVSPTHNSFSQIVFYWGVFPLFIYVLLLITLTKMLPPRSDTSLAAKITTIFFVSTFVLIIFTNNFNYKDFTVPYGLLLGLYLRGRYKLSN